MEELEEIHRELVEFVSAREGLRPVTVHGLTAIRTGEPVGDYAVLEGADVDKAVAFSVRVTSDDGGVHDLHWFHIFSPPVSLIPHVAIEWEGYRGPDGVERTYLLVDLLPRIDLAVNLEYVDEVYTPLTDAYRAVGTIPGVRREQIPPRRNVAISPWCTSVSVPAEHSRRLVDTVHTYLDRWISVMTGGVDSMVDPVARDQARLEQHDRFHRASLFDPASDPRWEHIDRFVGPDGGAEVRVVLRRQGAY